MRTLDQLLYIVLVFVASLVGFTALTLALPLALGIAFAHAAGVAALWTLALAWWALGRL